MTYYICWLLLLLIADCDLLHMLVVVVVVDLLHMLVVVAADTYYICWLLLILTTYVGCCCC